jgi:hypothetical protein
LTFFDTPDLRRSVDTLAAWVTGVHTGSVRVLWQVLDDDLRLATAQAFVLRQVGAPDDDAARALAAPHADGPMFRTMMAAVLQRWRTVYAPLANGLVITHDPMPVGAGMEVVQARGNPGFGSRNTHAAHRTYVFITRYAYGRGWLLAATGPKLPVPGWPPGEWIIPQLRRRPG